MAKFHLIFIIYLTVYIFYTYNLSSFLELHGTEKRSPCDCNCDTLSTAPDRIRKDLIQGSYFENKRMK